MHVGPELSQLRRTHRVPRFARRYARAQRAPGVRARAMAAAIIADDVLNDDAPKVLVCGPSRSGKTSILKVVFQKLSPHETLFLESTPKACGVHMWHGWDEGDERGELQSILITTAQEPLLIRAHA